MPVSGSTVAIHDSPALEVVELAGDPDLAGVADTACP
jgi:hypothetical protein